MRLFLAVLIILFSTDPAQTAEKNQSWMAGVWDEKRIENTNSLQLAMAGRGILLGESVDQNIHKAEELFNAAIAKDPSHSIFVGAVYLGAGNDKIAGVKPISDALRWFEKARVFNHKEATNWLGLLFRGVAKQISEARPDEPPSQLAMAWFQAGAHYGDTKSRQKLDDYRSSFSKTQLKEIAAESQNILEDPAANYDFLKGIIIAPTILFEK